MAHSFKPAPEWQVSEWLNRDAPLSVADLLGKVVVLHAFQMRCPGCLEFSIPQAVRAHAFYDPDEVAVVGLHTVFEHHELMRPEALKHFALDRGLAFPIGIDRHEPEQSIPETMRAYGMQGTPTVVLIDAQGRIRLQQFGHVDDLRLGTGIGILLSEARMRAATSR